MYSSALPGAVRNNQTWSSVTASQPSVNSVINALAFQDRDMNIMYTKGPNTTVMFYLSTKINLKSGGYVSVHRTQPGIVKNSNTYDATGRPWFKKAPKNSYNLYGPYVETFTRQPVITLSTMVTSSITRESLQTVAAAVMLISELSTIGEIRARSCNYELSINCHCYFVFLSCSEQREVHGWRLWGAIFEVNPGGPCVEGPKLPNGVSRDDDLL